MVPRSRSAAVLAVATAAVLAAAGALAAPVARAGAAAVGVAPHRAFYSFELESTPPGSVISDAKGAMFVEWVENCAGWSSSQRIQLRLMVGDKTLTDVETRFASWEARDGLSYQFSVQNYRGPVLEKELRGNAVLATDGTGGTAKFVLPEEKEMTLPAGVIFPLHHMKGLLAAAAAGKKLFSRVVFDGSTEDGAFEVNAVIGLPHPAPETDPLVPASLNGRSWPVRLAFFTLKSTAEVPFYELSEKLLATGVVREFFLDYGESVVKATLDRVEALARPSCGKAP